MGNTASTPTPQSSSTLPPGHPPAASNADAAAPPPGCPMHQSSSEAALPAPPTSTVTDLLNPLNNIPSLAQAPSASQKSFLSLERTNSSIPRVRSNSTDSATTPASACPVNHGDLKGKGKAAAETEAEDGNWVYPSPQQFYNALMRKGKDTPEESVEMMVQIHNWLNEKAWDEVRRWEDRRDPNERIELAKFEGRPQDLSPKARYHLFLGRLFPNAYNTTPPFDRHDWHVRRGVDGSFQRYVIDYYSAPNDEHGMPVFSLDVRPAVDSPGAVYDRLTEWARMKKEAWRTADDSSPRASA